MKKKLILALIILNVFLLIISVLCLIGTYKNDKFINSASCDFLFREGDNGRVVLRLETGNVEMRFRDDAVKVIGSHTKYSREEALSVVLFIRGYAAENGYEISRKNTDLYGEYRLHGFLYQLGIETEHTADADLDYGQDRRWYIEAASKVVGFMGL